MKTTILKPSQKPKAKAKSQAKSRKPKAESQKPKAKSQKPKAKSKKPKAESQKPKAKSRKPKAESRKPKAKSQKPKSEMLAPKCNKKHANQRCWLRNAANSKENCPRLKTKKSFKKNKHPQKNIPSFFKFSPNNGFPSCRRGAKYDLFLQKDTYAIN